MQSQVFIQSQSEQSFIASVVGMPNLTVEGRTEIEAIASLLPKRKAHATLTADRSRKGCLRITIGNR